MRIEQNNSGLLCQRKTTQFRLENENSEPQMWKNMVTWSFLLFAVSVILNLSILFLHLPEK